MYVVDSQSIFYFREKKIFYRDLSDLYLSEIKSSAF